MDRWVGRPATGSGLKGAVQQSCTHGQPAPDATGTMSLFRRCPTRRHRDPHSMTAIPSPPHRPLAGGCTSNQHCAEGSYCAQKGCAAGAGVCKPRPDGCFAVFKPVCGCDGKTYSNGCAAQAAGVNVDYDGVCPGVFKGLLWGLGSVQEGVSAAPGTSCWGAAVVSPPPPPQVLNVFFSYDLCDLSFVLCVLLHCETVRRFKGERPIGAATG